MQGEFEVEVDEKYRYPVFRVCESRVLPHKRPTCESQVAAEISEQGGPFERLGCNSSGPFDSCEESNWVWGAWSGALAKSQS